MKNNLWVLFRNTIGQPSSLCITDALHISTSLFTTLEAVYLRLKLAYSRYLLQ